MQKLLSKFISGRWIFTVVSALVFMYCAITKIFDSQTTKEIVMIVIVFYFQRPDRKNGADIPKGGTQ